MCTLQRQSEQRLISGQDNGDGEKISSKQGKDKAIWDSQQHVTVTMETSDKHWRNCNVQQKTMRKIKVKCIKHKALNSVLIVCTSYFRRRHSLSVCQRGNSDISDVLAVHALVRLVTDSSDVPTDRQHSSRVWKTGSPLLLNHQRSPSSTGNWSDCKVNWQGKKNDSRDKYTHTQRVHESWRFKPNWWEICI